LLISFVSLLKAIVQICNFNSQQVKALVAYAKQQVEDSKSLWAYQLGDKSILALMNCTGVYENFSSSSSPCTPFAVAPQLDNDFSLYCDDSNNNVFDDSDSDFDSETVEVRTEQRIAGFCCYRTENGRYPRGTYVPNYVTKFRAFFGQHRNETETLAAIGAVKEDMQYMDFDLVNANRITPMELFKWLAKSEFHIIPCCPCYGAQTNFPAWSNYNLGVALRWLAESEHRGLPQGIHLYDPIFTQVRNCVYLTL